MDQRTSKITQRLSISNDISLCNKSLLETQQIKPLSWKYF